MTTNLQYKNSMDRSERDTVEVILLFMDAVDLDIPGKEQIANELVLSAKNGDYDGAIEQLGKIPNLGVRIKSGLEVLGTATANGKINAAGRILSYVLKVDIEERHGNGTISSLLRR